MFSVVTSMLVTDVGDEICCWWQLWNVSDSLSHFDHQHQLSSYIHKFRASCWCHQHSKDVTNIEIQKPTFTNRRKRQVTNIITSPISRCHQHQYLLWCFKWHSSVFQKKFQYSIRYGPYPIEIVFNVCFEITHNFRVSWVHLFPKDFWEGSQNDFDPTPVYIFRHYLKY